SRRRHTRLQGDWSSDVCSSDLILRRFFPHILFIGEQRRGRFRKCNCHYRSPLQDESIISCRPQDRRRRSPSSSAHSSRGIRSPIDRKSTRLNSSHLVISYAVFC